MVANARFRDAMKPSFRWSATLGVALVVALPGCSRKTDTNAELEKAANSLASTQPVAVPAQQAHPDQAAPAARVAPPAAAPAQEMNQAMMAYKAGQLKDTVTHLQQLRAMPTITPQQRIAVNDAMAAVMTDIYTRAAKGDARAIQAVKQYELMQTRRR